MKCREDKYYVGITTKSPEVRFLEHVNKKHGAYWTMKYEPLEILKAISLGVMTKADAAQIENKTTRELMRQYGINNVRGGDVKDTDDYIQRFGYLFIKEDWQGIVYVILILVLLAAFYVDKYVVTFIPGGIR